MVAATKIIIEKVYINVTTASANAVSGEITVSATSGTATNAAVDTHTEIVGTGATYSNQIGGDSSVTEADINLAAAGVTFAHPGITVANTLKNVYLGATTALNADATAGRGNVVIEYTVI